MTNLIHDPQPVFDDGLTIDRPEFTFLLRVQPPVEYVDIVATSAHGAELKFKKRTDIPAGSTILSILTQPVPVYGRRPGSYPILGVSHGTHHRPLRPPENE